MGLLLGAIASATAPAATTDVLWEYKTRGPLTTTVLGIAALNDGLALILSVIVSSIAHDIMEPAISRKISLGSSLLEAEEVINKYGVDYLPIVNAESVLIGFIEKELIDKFVSSKLIEAKERAVSMG